MVRAELPAHIPVKELSIPLGDDGQHRGFLTLAFESHDVARAASETLQRSHISPRGLLIRFATAKPPTPSQSPYDVMLHKVRARMVATEQENLRLKAEMEVLSHKLQRALQKD